MDEIRRGAMAKMGRLAMGAVGAGAIVGTQARQTVGNPMPTAGRVLGLADSSNKQVESQKIAINRLGDLHHDPMREAREKVARPLYTQLEKLRGYGEPQSVVQYMNADHFPDVTALRSVSPWFKACVTMDRAKLRLSAIKTLEQEIQKLMTSPMDALEDTMRDAINGFLAEIQKS